MLCGVSCQIWRDAKAKPKPSGSRQYETSDFHLEVSSSSSSSSSARHTTAVVRVLLYAACQASWNSLLAQLLLMRSASI
jgi:hypothetical protein